MPDLHNSNNEWRWVCVTIGCLLSVCVPSIAAAFQSMSAAGAKLQQWASSVNAVIQGGSTQTCWNCNCLRLDLQQRLTSRFYFFMLVRTVPICNVFDVCYHVVTTSLSCGDQRIVRNGNTPSWGMLQKKKILIAITLTNGDCVFNILTFRFTIKFVIMPSLQIPLHIKCVK